MRGSELAEAMAVAVDRLVSAREGASALDRAIEATVGKIGRFGGKDATSYLEAYKSEMQMRDIPEDRRLAGFPRVVTPHIHAEVVEIQAGCRDWAEFSEEVLEKYSYDDSLRLSRKDFMDWVNSPDKGQNASALLQDFESRFARLSRLDRTVLETSKVLFFVTSFDSSVRESVGLLLETNRGLTTDWATVKEVCSRIDKRRDWKEKGSSPAGPVVGIRAEPIPTRGEEARRWSELGPPPANVAARPAGGAGLEELTRMVRDLQIAQARRSDEGPPRDRRPPAGQRCVWCDAIGHARRDCADFGEALRSNVVYLSNGRVHASDTRRSLDTNFGRGGMKRLMEEAAARHVEAVHYSASAGIRAGEKPAKSDSKPGFWPVILDTISGGRLRREEAEHADERVREATGWSDPVEENTGFVEAACKNYEALIDERRVGKNGGTGPTGRHDTRSAIKKHDGAPTESHKGEKGKIPSFRLSSEIEKATNLQKVLEERVLDSRIELTLREVLGIARREFHDSIVDLVKRKRLATEPEPEKPAEVRAALLDEMVVEDELAESHYAKPHWARATTETPVRIGDVKDPVVALIDHGSEINLMSMDFYKKGNWPINTKHGWKIRAATRATEELHGACPNVSVRIGDVDIDQHFFVQETSSHPVILGEPYITAARMETKVLDDGSAYARVKSQDGRHSVQFLTVRKNHERNRGTLGDDGKLDF